MENWFKDFQAEHGAKYPWIVKYETGDGTIHEDQVAGDDAQDVADYVREVNGHSTMIHFISKLDNTWT